MIIDTLNNLRNYTPLNPLFADVAAYLESHDLQTMEPGKYPIKDNDLFLNLAVAKGKTKEEAELETHVEMVDIQIPLSCGETFGYTPLADLPDAAYNAEKDITKYGDTPVQTYVTLKPGQMAIFFPQDGHAPCISEHEGIKKAIFKVKCVE